MIYIYIFYIQKLSASKKLRFALGGWKKTYSPDEVVKKPSPFAIPVFCYRFFFFLIVLQEIVITVANIIDLVL